MRKVITDETNKLDNIKDEFLFVVKALEKTPSRCDNGRGETSASKIKDLFEKRLKKHGCSFGERIEDAKYTNGIGNNRAYYIKDDEKDGTEYICAAGFINNMYGSVNFYLMNPLTYKKVSGVYKINVNGVQRIV